ncbi:hydroxyacid dehydrogenase [Terrabacter sp. MAHUQ-38]|uniref:hydroxyacid dehydrogenase n=1 Tax=unclassified Terrabacter TaxID=2630222 RepID=UPI00165D6FB1|nr:hydroxyacid dehydrogenase [Terrabacter sp. MAHUQ-38]
MSSRPLAVLAMDSDLPARLFDEATRHRMLQVLDVDFSRPVGTFDDVDPEQLTSAEVLITGWGSPRIDSGVLDRAPALRAVLHAAGSVRSHVDPVCWERGILVTTAADANAQPVAEYALAMIILSAKEAFRAQALYRTSQKLDHRSEFASVGCNGRRVGLVGASRIGRRVVELLAGFDFEIWLSDPYVDAREASRLGVRLAPLEDLLRACDVVSLHAPLLPSTHHLLDAGRLALMRDGATLVNTARGGLVDHDALVAELETGRIRAVLDATDPHEPLEADSPILALDNVVVTPHVAGALGNELFRLGAHAVENAVRLVGSRPLQGLVSLDELARMA